MTQTPPRERIREIDITDLPESTALYIRVFNAPPWNDAWTDETAAARLAHTLDTPGSLGLGVWQAGKLVAVAVGYAEQWYDGQHFLLKELFVDPGTQGSGVGTRLMHRLEQELQERRMEYVYLLTARDSHAAAFYRKLGYRESESTILMTSNLPDQEVCDPRLP